MNKYMALLLWTCLPGTSSFLIAKDTPAWFTNIASTSRLIITLLEKNLYYIKAPLLHQCVKQKTQEKKEALEKLLEMLILIHLTNQTFTKHINNKQINNKQITKDLFAYKICAFILTKQPEVNLALDYILQKKSKKKHSKTYWFIWISLGTAICGSIVYYCYKLLNQIKQEITNNQKNMLTLQAQEAQQAQQTTEQLLRKTIDLLEEISSTQATLTNQVEEVSIQLGDSITSISENLEKTQTNISEMIQVSSDKNKTIILTLFENLVKSLTSCFKQQEKKTTSYQTASQQSCFASTTTHAPQNFWTNIFESTSQETFGLTQLSRPSTISNKFYSQQNP